MNFPGGYLPPPAFAPAPHASLAPHPAQQILDALIQLHHLTVGRQPGVGSAILNQLDNAPMPVNAGQVAAGTAPALYPGQTAPVLHLIPHPFTPPQFRQPHITEQIMQYLGRH